MLKTLLETVRQRKIEISEQLKLPEGTKVLVTVLPDEETEFWSQSSKASLDNNMLQISSEPLTLEKFLTLPETKPASEYINGQIIQKPMPQGEHSAIQTELSTAINATLKSSKIARAFSELRCTFGGRSIVPDVSVFTYERIPRKQNGGIANVFKIAPDWTIEILSPGQNQTKVTTNILHCLDNGTQLGWLIDPSVQAVLVYFPKQQPASFEAAKDSLPVPQFANTFKLTVGNLFNWLY